MRTIQKGDYQILRGYYLTGLGQEGDAYYFKLSKEHPLFQKLQAGDVIVSFYQTKELITSIPALVRVDGVIENLMTIKATLAQEKKKHVPHLPVVKVYENFDPIHYAQLMDSYQALKKEMRQLSQFQVVQGSLFDMDEGECYESY
ncbi:UNVERIFIED_CONTAM: hypothetical protein KB573_01485 [Streptococcus canis]|uniref:hypothetical protein n=1 Tax=Streptococcus canis TaxID=1329 RepID=UPI001142B90C|nr:hypothetical protein [Streptococcus canis]MDV6000770.1 hypothetical protein [Streptococcus canis]MDV6021966.1 hypothetical protein [Streptococcus canis]GEE06307.1 hypothetical protein ScOT1_04000 [Streptococcus canis]